VTGANFVVLFPGVGEYAGFTDEPAVLATFGKPARTYHVGSYLVLVWNKNLLRTPLSRCRGAPPGAILREAR